MKIAATLVHALRKRTGMPIWICQDALIRANGDMEKAIRIIREESGGFQPEFEDQVVTEGRIGVHIDPASRSGGIIELRCGSAVAARNDLFIQLASDLARQVALKGAESPEELLSQDYVGGGKTVHERIGEVVGLMGEKIQPARLASLKGVLGSYVHHDGSVGVLLEVEGPAGNDTLLRDVCMHIAARNPLVALRQHVLAEKVASEMEIARTQAAAQGKGKPANIIQKIAEGKMRTWFAENVLAEQPFVKDDTKTVGAFLQAAGLKLVRFVRFKVGQVTN
jgi:elongation factor Ts